MAKFNDSIGSLLIMCSAHEHNSPYLHIKPRGGRTQHHTALTINWIGYLDGPRAQRSLEPESIPFFFNPDGEEERAGQKKRSERIQT